MLNLSKDDRKQLRQAITSGFRSYSALKLFVSDHFKFGLNEITSSTATKVAADELIEHFEQGSDDGDVADLIRALFQERPRNPEVQALMRRLEGFLRQHILLEPTIGEGDDLPLDLALAYDDLELESFIPQSLSYEADFGKLRRGLQLGDSVCRIVFTDRATTGTGLLIAPDLVLTNYHVLNTLELQDRSMLDEKAKTLLFEFGVMSQEAETPTSPQTFTISETLPIVACSPPTQLDYALLRVEPKIRQSIQSQPIRFARGLLSPKAGLNVLQHPAGTVMQVSLSASGVVQVNPQQNRVWYVNRTQKGSSGAPCFNEDWELVALHHGSMSRGFGSIREGILISSIFDEVSGFLG
jgi:endonuclease G, mitochondrial